jgi:hypothetical protein
MVLQNNIYVFLIIVHWYKVQTFAVVAKYWRNCCGETLGIVGAVSFMAFLGTNCSPHCRVKKTFASGFVRLSASTEAKFWVKLNLEFNMWPRQVSIIILPGDFFGNLRHFYILAALNFLTAPI